MPASEVAHLPPGDRASWVGKLGGNAAAAGLLARQTATAEPPAPAAKPLSHAEEVTKATDELVALVTAAAGSYVGSEDKRKGKPIAESIPDMLRTRITRYGKKPSGSTDALQPLIDVLWGDDVKAALTALDKHAAPKGGKAARAKKQKAARIKVLMAIQDRLIPDVAEGAAVEAPEAALDSEKQIEEERKLRSARLKRLTQETKKVGKGKKRKKITVDEWDELRIPVLVQFGALSVGPREALNRANAYYDALVPGKLFGVSLHGSSFVHTELQAAFDRATAYVDGLKIDDKKHDKLKEIAATGFSTNIRENRNAPDQLSDHSFGWAVDFAADYNPNVKDAAMAPVEDVTGKDPKDVLTNKSKPMKAADVEKKAEELREISSDYVKAMESKESLAPVLLKLVNKARGEASLTPLAVSAQTAIVDAATTKSGREAALRAAIHPEGAAATGKPPKQITQLEDTLERVGDTFNESFVKGERKGASSEGSRGSVAAHGFMNLPALFAAALAGTDAGGLRWLQHDRMHFETVKEPELYGATPPPKDEGHADAD